MAVITISRQLGSGGAAIARQVAEALQYRYFDKQLLIEAAAEVGLSRDHVVDYSEDRYEVRNVLARLLHSRGGTSGCCARPPAHSRKLRRTPASPPRTDGRCPSASEGN